MIDVIYNFLNNNAIIVAIIGWWFNKQYDRYIEDLIEIASDIQNEHAIKFNMYQHNIDTRQYVKSLYDEYNKIQDKTSREAKEKYNELCSWFAPIKITKYEARQKFNIYIFILYYVIPIMPGIKCICNICNICKPYIINIWKYK